jgi:hypothetical protein
VPGGDVVAVDAAHSLECASDEEGLSDGLKGQQNGTVLLLLLLLLLLARERGGGRG